MKTPTLDTELLNTDSISHEFSPIYKNMSLFYFLKYLRTHNVFSIALAAIITERVSLLTESFINEIVMPLIDRDYNKDGKKDMLQLEKRKIRVFGAELGVGKVLKSLIYFFITTYILYLMMVLIKKGYDRIL